MSKAIEKYTAKQLFSRDSVRKKFEEVLGKNAKGFVTSVLQAINDNKMLAEASPESVYNAAMTAAVLDLPVNHNLGFAYIIPYRVKGKVVAQFQMGYKGFIQLCQRSGLFKTISVTPIYEGQIVDDNPLTGYEFNFSVKGSDEVIGYASYFSLLNGFEKVLYMSTEGVEHHAKTYSQSYRSGNGPWSDNFDGMALKTVLKLLLSKFAPMTIDIQKAIEFDQAEVTSGMEVRYIDNQSEAPQQAEQGRKPIDTSPAVAEVVEEGKEEMGWRKATMDEKIKEKGLPF